MMISPVRLSTSLGLAWAFAGQQAAALGARLGLGPLGFVAMLPRAVSRMMDGELKRLEMMVRRILFLVAMETPLPAVRLASPRQAPDRSAAPAQPEEPRVFTMPAFRLTETSRSPEQKASRLASRLAARGRHEADPAFRPGPHDLLPAKSG